MQLFWEIKDAAAFLRQGAAVTIGGFDGIHVGHQAIIDELIRLAGKEGLKSVLVTFDPHPQQVLSPHDAPPLLTTTEEKIRLLERCNLDAAIVLKFSREFSQIRAQEFLEKYILEQLSCHWLVMGLNHTFGYRREGSVDFLRENTERYGYHLAILEPVLYGGKPVRSSRIRREIAGGDFGAALEMLGHDLEIEGVVVKGKGVGTSLGFPTINVQVPHEKIIPPSGVYAAYNLVGSTRRFGMMYVGQRNSQSALEVNLFDYHGDLYGQKVRVYPTKFVRPSRRFDDQNELVKQIERDEQTIKSIFNLV